MCFCFSLAAAVCLQKCKNGGECLGPNTCQCATGWEGLQCQTGGFIHQVVNLNRKCFFLLFFSPLSEIKPLLSAVCTRRCLNGGRCVLPDYCHCRRGFKGPTCALKVSAVGFSFIFSLFISQINDAILLRHRSLQRLYIQRLQSVARVQSTECILEHQGAA